MKKEENTEERRKHQRKSPGQPIERQPLRFAVHTDWKLCGVSHLQFLGSTFCISGHGTIGDSVGLISELEGNASVSPTTITITITITKSMVM